MPQTGSLTRRIIALVVVCLLIIAGVVSFLNFRAIQMSSATSSIGPADMPLAVIAPSTAKRFTAEQPTGATPEAAFDTDQSFGTPEAPTTERLIIKNIQTSVVVDSVEAAIASLSKYAEQEGGFVAYTTANEYSGLPTGQIVLRIPADKLSKTEETVRALGIVESFTADGEDVTDEYVDLDARVRNLKASEVQFLAIMKNAFKIEDILAVQRELVTVRTEIDTITGRMKYLTESARLATVSVFLSTDAAGLEVLNPRDAWKPVAVIKQAAHSLLSFAKSIGSAIIWVLVFAPVWILLGLLIWFVVRRYKKSVI